MTNNMIKLILGPQARNLVSLLSPMISGKTRESTPGSGILYMEPSIKPSNSQTSRPSTIYGPVLSWRYGRSLGVDPIVETSTCSFNCIYCQLGEIQRKTTERRVFVPTAYVEADLEGVNWDEVDVVTISGSGEPTLAANLEEIIQAIRRFTKKPIHLLTNATMLYLPEVRQQVRGLDVIGCKLDAPNDAMLKRINRPVEGVTLERIVEGILALKAEFPGRLALQIMFMPANVKEVEALVPLICRIQPDEVDLNTPRRPYPLEWYQASRGDHESKYFSGEKRTLKVITPEEAAWAERTLREKTGVELVSVYRDG